MRVLRVLGASCWWTYPGLMKDSDACGRSFTPSSRHLVCPACRSKDVCTCGATKQLKSAQCWECRPKGEHHNGRWKGGRSYHSNGYPIVRAKGHPRATKSGYVFEHILVMEEMVGRYLLPDENVHHRNGVKDDNRPKNLELWVRPQPPGIRVDDAIAWAKEILERYAGVWPPPTTLTDEQ